MKHLIVWVSAALAMTVGLACGGHTPQAAAPSVHAPARSAGSGTASAGAKDPPPRPKDKKAMCEQAMSHVLDLVEKEARPVTADERARFMHEGVTRCMADDVSRTELACIASVKTLEELDKCEPASPDSDQTPGSKQAPKGGQTPGGGQAPPDGGDD